MKNIYKALAAFQQEVPPIHKGTKGFGYSYADLSAIFKVINPLLKKHQLGFTQLLNGEDLKTVIFHIESGEFVESVVHIQQDVQLAKMNTFQVLGSAITYYRRYSLSAALGLITDKDIDACGEAVAPQSAPITPKKKVNLAKAVEMLESALDLDKLKAVWTEIGKDNQQNEVIINKAKEIKTKLSA